MATSRLSSKVYTPFIWLYRPVRMEARLGVDKELVQKQLSRVTPSAASLFILSACAYFASTLPYIPHVCDVWSSLSMNRMLGLSSGRPHGHSPVPGPMRAGKQAMQQARLRKMQILFSYQSSVSDAGKTRQRKFTKNADWRIIQDNSSQTHKFECHENIAIFVGLKLH